MNQISEYDGPDGSFVSVLRLPNGTMQRVWGHYRATQVSDSQMQTQFEVEGWLPREICTQSPGYQMQCSPYTIPTSGSGTLTFVSPTAFVANGVTMMRDPSPYLLQQQMPERAIVYGQAPAQPGMQQPGMQQPVVPGGSRYVPLNRPAGPQCDDLQQQRLCAINNGHYERSGGCLVCVPP